MTRYERYLCIRLGQVGRCMPVILLLVTYDTRKTKLRWILSTSVSRAGEGCTYSYTSSSVNLSFPARLLALLSVDRLVMTQAKTTVLGGEVTQGNRQKVAERKRNGFTVVEGSSAVEDKMVFRK